jgi:hypothetical protein
VIAVDRAGRLSTSGNKQREKVNQLKKSIVVAMVAALAIPFAGLTSLVQAQGLADFPSQGSNQWLKGTYAFLQGATQYGYTSSVGTLTFDGNGGLTGVLDLNYDGQVCVGMTLNGTYAVTSSRTATANLIATSVNTANCANAGNGATLALSLSFSAKPLDAQVRMINLVEMDQEISGTFADDFYGLSGVATLH